MDMPEVKAFNAELSGLYDNKPPISKAKMSAITKGAIKAIKFYKHVVHSVEKFIQKCKPEYKVPGLYVIDSIVRQSRHQFGQDKDVFAPRFAKNMQQTFANLFRCPPEDKRNIIRVLNLWQKNNVFSPQVIQPLLDMADPNHPLHQEIQQQNNTANGSTLNVSHASDNKMSPQHSPHASSPMGGDQFQDEPDPQPKFNRKLLNDFEYDSEDDMPADTGGGGHSTQSSHPSHTTHMPHANQHSTQQNTTDALGSILTNPEIMRQLQSLQAQMSMMTGMQIPNLMPMMSDLQMQQNQTQGLPFMGAQQDGQKQSETKDDMGNNESDIEFVETGPQVIEIPDANDSSPSPKSRRHRSRSKSPRRRRRSRSRSRSPRRRRDRDRDRDRERDRDKDKDREKSYKEREADREKQREREKKGLPPIKKENLSVCSTTLWVGHLSKLATPEELSDLFGSVGGVASIDVVAPRGCAFVVMERRRDAAKALAKLNKHKLHSKEITVAWAPGKGVKGREWKDQWEAERGVSYLPWAQLQARWALGALSLDALEDGGAVDEDTLPPWLPPRILPKSMMDNMTMMAGMPPPPSILPSLPPGNMPLPPVSLAGALPPVSLAPNLTSLPAPNLSLPHNMTASLAVTRMPPPGMAPGMPPGLAPGMPPGIRPPSIPAGVPGLQTDAGLPPTGPLLRFPPGMPPQTIPQPGMVGGFLGGLLGVGVGGLVGGVPLLHHAPMHHATPPQPAQQQRLGEVNQCDDAMDLDTEEHTEERTNDEAPALLPDQIQALLSKPPPTFNASEPPPGFNLSEPPPFNLNQPPPSTEDKQDEDRKDRDRDRRDRDRDRRDRGDRRDRDRRDRDRGGRDRDRNERDDRRDNRDGRDNRGERDNRDRAAPDTRDRDRDRGRDRRDRDRDRERGDRQDRFANRTNDNNGDRSREKSPRSGAPADNAEKSLQERLWEMANGKPADKREDFDGELREERPPLIDRVPPRHDGPPPMDGVAEGESGADNNWTALAPPRMPPPHLAPPFRAELRMRGPPRPPNMQGPWMEGHGPGPGPFGPRFNGMGPPFNRPPFDGPRPPFDGAPLFEGGPRFERPPFARMPFDAINRPPFDGPRPPFDGPRPPFDGPRPFDGPPFDGDRPPRFDGPPEFFDRGRRFDDREQFQDRWGGDRDRGDREWGDRERRPEWDDRRRDRRDRPGQREHEDRFNRDRNSDRRRPYDENRPRRQSENRQQPDTPTKSDSSKQDAPPADAPKPTDTPKQTEPPKADPPKDEERKRRDRDRKSRWGAAEEPSETTDSTEPVAASNDTPPESMDIAESEPGNDHSTGAEVTDRMEESHDTHEKGSMSPVSESAVREISESRGSSKDEQYEENSEAPASDDVSAPAVDTYTEDKQYESDAHTSPAADTYAEEKQFEREDDAPADVDTYSEEKQYDRQEDDEQSYSPPEESEAPAPVEAAREAPMTDLYDAGDAVDTSFSMSAPPASDSPAPPPVEADVQPMDEATKAVDMFSSEREQKEEGESGNARSSSTENKEGA